MTRHMAPATFLIQLLTQVHAKKEVERSIQEPNRPNTSGSNPTVKPSYLTPSIAQRGR